jgi:hypothetical protein
MTGNPRDIQGMLAVIMSDASQDVVYPEDIAALAGALTVRVTVRNKYGNDLVDPANDAARTFAQISGHKTLTLATVRGIRALGFAIEVMPGEASKLPEGW